MAAGDRAAERVEARVVGRDADALAPREHLHRERLVQLEEADLVDGEPGLREHLLGRGHGAEPHQVRLDARVGEADESEARLEAELGGGRLGREERRGRAVGQPGGVAGRHAPARAERRPERREPLEGRVGAEELVPLGDCPALVGEDAHRDDGVARRRRSARPRGRGAALRLGGVPVGGLARQRGKRVVEVLGRLAHHGGALVDEALGDEARVELDLLAHRVVAHVLDAARDREVAGAHRDLARRCGDRGQRAGAHPVDGEARAPSPAGPREARPPARASAPGRRPGPSPP